MRALPADEPPPDRRSSTPLGLSSLLQATAERSGGRPAFVDQPNREAWTQRPRLQWTYALADRVVRRLAEFFAALQLPQRVPVGVHLPSGSEACLAILAIERAGLTPCLLPVDWTEQELSLAIEITGSQAVVTQGVLGDERPAELFCRVAARRYALRFVCAFGPRVPDGVFDLDQVMLRSETVAQPSSPRTSSRPEGDLVTFARGAAGVAVRRAARSLVASSAAYLAATRIEPGDRILSLLPPDDHAGLATGLAAALIGGATLECHGYFDAPSLLEALDRPGRTHLVAPGWLESPLSDSNVTDRLASTILVHPAPVRFQAKTALKRDVVDVLALGELALLAKARDERGRVALSFATEDAGSARDLLRVRQGEDSSILVGGLAAETTVFARSGLEARRPTAEWRDSGFKADRFAGLLIAVS